MDLWYFDQHNKKLDEVATDISFVVNPSSTPDLYEAETKNFEETANFVKYDNYFGGEDSEDEEEDEEGQSEEQQDDDENETTESHNDLCLSRSLEAGKREKGFSISQMLPHKEYVQVTRLKRSHSTVEKRQKPTAAEALGACNSKEEIREALRYISTKQSKELQSCWLIIQRLVDKLKEQRSTKEELVKENHQLRRQLSSTPSSPIAIKCNKRPDESPQASPQRAISPLSPCTTALKRRKNLNDSFPTSPKKSHF